MRTNATETARKVERALRSLAPSWVRTGARPIDSGDVDGLWPGELGAVAGAVASRQAEFASGRSLLRQLIGADVEIGVGPDRRPQLPDGTIGSLAHDREIVVAAITTRSSCRSLGIDIEPAATFTSEEARLILRPDEQHLDTHLVFVLKEAVYKAWSSCGGGMLDHHDVAVDVDGSARNFTAIVGSIPTQFTGRYCAVEGRYAALVVADAASSKHCEMPGTGGPERSRP